MRFKNKKRKGLYVTLQSTHPGRDAIRQSSSPLPYPCASIHASQGDAINPIIKFSNPNKLQFIHPSRDAILSISDLDSLASLQHTHLKEYDLTAKISGNVYRISTHVSFAEPNGRRGFWECSYTSFNSRIPWGAMGGADYSHIQGRASTHASTGMRL
jgi:hypothetical protein